MPLDKDLTSSAEILHGRPHSHKGKIPTQSIHITDVKNKLQANQAKTQDNKTKGIKWLSYPLSTCENLLIQQKDGNWEPATFTKIGSEERSYLSTTTTSKVFCRNRKHIQKTGMPDIPQQDLHPCFKQELVPSNHPKNVNHGFQTYTELLMLKKFTLLQWQVSNLFQMTTSQSP